MKKKVISIVVLLLSSIINSQIIDNYGIKIGAGLSNQYWEYNDDVLSDLYGWNENKTSLIGQVFVEKKINKHISFKPAIGYVQKGFMNNNHIPQDDWVKVVKNKLVLHNLSLDLSLKIFPFDKIVKPYIILGLRGDYLLDYQSEIILSSQGIELELDSELHDDFNKYNLGAIIGIGASYRDLVSIDLEFNPAITKNLESSELVIYDKYVSLSLSVNINR